MARRAVLHCCHAHHSGVNQFFFILTRIYFSSVLGCRQLFHLSIVSRYGDIGPSNNESRMFIMVVILVSFTSVGRLLGRITAAIARSSPWRMWYVPQKKQPHIIMAGAPEGYYLKFFAELFSEVQRFFLILLQQQ